MKEKTSNYILLLLSIAPFIITAIGIQFLPDQIPMHYNAAGEIDRWGSKYEEFILAVAFSLSGWILWLVARFSGCFADTEEEYVKAKENAKIVRITGIATQLFLCVLQIIFLIGAAKEASSGATVSVMPIWKIVGLGTGILFVLLGNIMPKAKPNSLVGIRTPWSFSSEEMWVKSQRIGGISFAIGGALCILFSLIMSGFVIFWVIMITTLGAAAVSVLYPVYLEKHEIKGESEKNG